MTLKQTPIRLSGLLGIREAVPSFTRPACHHTSIETRMLRLYQTPRHMHGASAVSELEMHRMDPGRISEHEA